MEPRVLRGVLAAAACSVGLAVVAVTVAAKPPFSNSRAYPAQSRPFGHSYTEWSADYWKWALGRPVDGHPFVDSPSFDLGAGQQGPVWFLATPVDGSQALTTTNRAGEVPSGTSLFVSLFNSEWSDLEGYATETEQRETANFFGDHIVGLSCTLDGVPVVDLSEYRFETAQFSFIAPSPWIFGTTGGVGRAVADGYYVMLKPMAPGHHVVHISGAFHFSVAEGDPFDFDTAVDATYLLDVIDD